MHAIGYLGHSMGATKAIYALYLKFLTRINLVAEFHRENVSFTRGVIGNVCDSSLARWKADSRLAIGYN